MPDLDLVQALDGVMKERFANRFFADRPVPYDSVRAILEAARHAPSGANTQPWRVHALAGAAKARICADILPAHAGEAAQYASEYTSCAASYSSASRRLASASISTASAWARCAGTT